MAEEGMLTSQTPAQTFTFFKGAEEGKGNPNYLYEQRGRDDEATVEDLESYFNADKSNRLRESFGTFDNYLSYMNERQDLIDSGQLKPDWWDTGKALVDVEALGREGGMDDKALEQNIVAEGARQGAIGYSEQADLQNSWYQKYTGEAGPHYNP